MGLRNAKSYGQRHVPNITCLSSTAPPSDEYLDQEELNFVCGFDALMEASHYKRLSQAEWETAEREEFTVRFSTF